MKKLSIKSKITLWFSTAIFLIVALMFCLLLVISDSVIQKNIRDSLIELVENNADEVEYCSNLNQADLDDDDDQYIQYLSGYLEIDDDFLDSMNGIYIGLYDGKSTMLYGENPIASSTENLLKVSGIIQTVPVNGEKYYFYDKKLVGTNLNNLWLRGIVSKRQGTTQVSSILKCSLVMFPLLAILAIIGGYLIAGHSLRPLKKITQTAEHISKSCDLAKRIHLEEGNDELHRLAETFDSMFDRLESSFEAERQFTSDASHELRTPMAVIAAQCEYTLEQPRKREEYIEALEIISRQGKKMSKLISDLLFFTRIEQKTDQLQMKTLELSSLVSDICGEVTMMSEHHITLEHKVKLGIIVQGNRELLTRLLLNLITNAYRYGRENGYILVKLTENKKEIHLSVTDNGIGIAKTHINKIWNRFYQVDPSRGTAGAGLGLSMVKQIAQLHGGKMTVESILGKGSIFTLILPKI